MIANGIMQKAPVSTQSTPPATPTTNPSKKQAITSKRPSFCSRVWIPIKRSPMPVSRLMTRRPTSSVRSRMPLRRCMGDMCRLSIVVMGL